MAEWQFKFSDKTYTLSGTEFQVRVWQEILAIPGGQTISYKELARRIGHPKSARAVANACGANTLPVIVPCHRVICSDGSIGGYSGAGGVARKRQLLEQEKVPTKMK